MKAIEVITPLIFYNTTRIPFVGSSVDWGYLLMFKVINGAMTRYKPDKCP